MRDVCGRMQVVLAADVTSQRLEAEKAALEAAQVQSFVCSRMLTYAHICSHMLTDAHVCSRMQVESFEDAAQARLEQIYRELAARNADARESVARRILLGLGQCMRR